MMRIKPANCSVCGREPWLCESCGDYQCGCPLPWLVQRTKNHRIVPRVHYDKSGKRYPVPANLDVSPYPDDSDEEDITWLIES